MVAWTTILLHLFMSIFLFTQFPCTAKVVASTRTKNILMQILMHVRRKRDTEWDFTELNLGLCPPSLCRAHDEQTGEAKPRPKGTGGTVFYQGDIVLDNKMTRYIYPEERERRRNKRATMRPRRRLWKNGVVVYRFAKAISPEAKKAIERGMKHIQKRTCITFREKEEADRDFIRFISEPGCWSQVGHVGGVQLVSLGRGCEAPGTAVHEMTHALGVWHEQARPDRNKYVKILDNNISDKFKPDFEIVSKRIASSRGYPYDYRSLMHYSKFAFTKNGRPTIEVIGIGKKLGMRIGQRSGLSTIDLSQIREMYKCNQRDDENESVCPKGFRKIGLTCYKVFANAKAQFGQAFTTCKDHYSNMLIIDDKREDRLLSKYLNKKFANVTTWRIGARRVNNEMMWKTSAGRYKEITYSNWAKGHPSSYTSAIIQKQRDTFKWYGEWVGSANQKPNYEHPFICEKPARRKCVNGTTVDGRDYRGELDHTRGGHTCQRWTENYPHDHPLFNASQAAAETDAEEDEDGLGDHNHCRNPSGLRRARPWCYTTKKKVEWDFCDIRICAKAIKAHENRISVSRRTTVTRRTTERPRSGKSNYGAYGTSGGHRVASSRASGLSRGEAQYGRSTGSSASTRARSTRRGGAKSSRGRNRKSRRKNPSSSRSRHQASSSRNSRRRQGSRRSRT